MRYQKTVIVSGCSSGLGREIARSLKVRGWHVFATARKDSDVENLVQEGFDAMQLDVDSSESIRHATGLLLKACGGSLGALVNNAGFTQIGAVEDLSRETLRKQFETNFFGPIELTNTLIPLFRRQGYGRIVFIASSDNNGFAFPMLGAESASKNALVSVCTALRRELWGTNIHVSYVCPGALHTRIMQKALQELPMGIAVETSAQRQRYEKMIPFFARSAQGSRGDEVRRTAKVVCSLLESRKPKVRVVVPFSTKLHFWAHRHLTERVLDFLLWCKMKFVYKIL